MSPRAETSRPPAQKRERDRRETLAVFLGAGASKTFGYPLTGELLPNLVEYLKNGTLSKWGYGRKERGLLETGFQALLPGLGNVRRDSLPLITDIFTLLDHAMAVDSALLAGWPRERVRVFRGLIEQVVADMVTPDGAPATDELHRVADWVEAATRDRRVGVVTTNYDMELELALFERVGSENVASEVDFGMRWCDPGEDDQVVHARPARPKLAHYKLHGSVNWLRCPLCEHIYVNVRGSVVHWAWEAERNWNNECHCGHWPLQSVLVTPSFVRETREVNLTGIWRSALEFLASADRWLIVGYSMPAEDVAIRTLLMKAHRIRAAKSSGPRPQVWVVQGSDDLEDRFRLLLPGARYWGRGLASFDLAKVSR